MSARFLILLSALAGCFAAIPYEYATFFSEWALKFNMQFENEVHRGAVFEKWVSNHVFIQKVNAKNLTYTLGHNQFSGMDSNDFSKYLGYSSLGQTRRSRRGLTVGTTRSLNVVELPASVDWVEKGAVTPVKDQGQCGSCWSFSATGALEGAYFISTGILKSFSEQQLVDCDNFKHGGRDHGCNGGLMDNAFSWISKNGGLCVETDYPYVSGTTKTAGECNTECKEVDIGTMKYTDVLPNSDEAMMSALSQQPVSVAIEADTKEFQLYKSGILTADCGTELDHGVLLVGYGTDEGKSYYKIKNSWSSSWGESGYIRIGLGKEYGEGGECGVLLEGSVIGKI